MSRIQCRGSIAGAAVVVALFSSRPADAQMVAPGEPRESGTLLNNMATGVQYDIVNQQKAERRLQQVQEKLRSDAERGDRAAVGRDARRIDNLRFRIVVDEWLIRQNSLLDPGCYPYPVRLDPMSCAAIADAARPAPWPSPSQSLTTPAMMQGPMPMSAPYPAPAPAPAPTPTATPTATAAAPTIPITIVNAEATGPDVAFAIDGTTHQLAAASRQDLAVAPDSTITYDGGGSLGRRRYSISPGLYEFRSTAEGRALYKLASTR